ncbi:MAG: response regulator [Deltaproteobacteria bacterium]|nr:response regulator [Deltaproteobacteria bacterium]
MAVKHTILIVDDSPTMRQFISFTLKRIKDVEVIEVSDGVAGLKKLRETPISLVFSDVNMPMMDGFAFLSSIKSDAATKDIPVVMLTSEGAKEEIEKGKNLGAATYLTKPINTHKLIFTAREILKIS